MFQFVTKIPFRVVPILSSLWNTMNETATTTTTVTRKPRYDGRTKKRQWEERRTDKGAGLGTTSPSRKIAKDETEVTADLIERIKRRKFALLLGYSGVGYFGMQRNPKTATIEEELFKALRHVQYISDEAFVQIQTVQFQRAARTDKGVSAARQVVSLKLPEEMDVTRINEQLPQTIRIFGAKRVTKGFNSKSQCDSRTYFYMIPTVAFVPYEELMRQAGFRLPSETLERINQLLQKFLGTKNFHNFTSKKKPNDPSAKRYMKSFECDAPIVRQDVEFVLLRVQGQSFMMHQIRKMVGLTVAIIKGCTGEDTLTAAFGMDRVNVPKAPGLGLVLDYVHYDRYNYRYGEDGMHEKLMWDDVEDSVNDFKEKYIYPTIIDTEIKEEMMIQWIVRKLSGHRYDVEDEEDDKSDDEEKVVGTVAATAT